jgi:hypothetical protein
VNERDDLRENLRGVRESKRIADQSWRDEKQKNTQLEADLTFYQTQSARAMADRDRAAWEAEDLRGQALDLDRQGGSRPEPSHPTWCNSHCNRTPACVALHRHT